MPDPIIVQRMNAYRAALLRQEAAQMRDMATRWQSVERNLAQGITDVLDEIARREAAGEDFGRTFGPYVRLERYQTLLRQVRGELGKYGAYTEAQVAQGIAQHVAMGVEHSTAAIEVLAGGERSVLAQFNRLSVPASENMAAALQADAPVGQLLAGAWPDAAVRMTEAIINGVALGWNPRKTAQAMREGLRGALQRSLVIARTEQLRAYRTASLENYRQSGVVTAYKRLAAKSVRTCIACLIADGRIYALEESFDEHPNGRCTLVPILVGRPEPTWETGRTWFERQPAATQRQLLGSAAFEAWRAGAIQLEDLVERHEHPVWGGSLGVKSLRRLLGEDAKQYVSQAYSAAGVKRYYEKPDKTKVMGFTWYDVDKSGALPSVGKAIAAGRDKVDGWEANERVFKEEYLPKHKVHDDVKRTLGLWGTPEPSFNAWVKGSRENILALAEDWRAAYNQQAVALLLPNPQGTGGALSWDFGRRLTVREMDAVLGRMQVINDELKQERKQDKDTFVWEIGLTVLGRRRVEFWVPDAKQQQVGETLLRRAFSEAGLSVPKTGWEGGYDWELIQRPDQAP